jgi:hypothetical protein
MGENLDVLNTAVSLLIRAVLLAARFSGRVRRRSLKRLAAMDTDAKAAREILFLKDRVCGPFTSSWPSITPPAGSYALHLWKGPMPDGPSRPWSRLYRTMEPRNTSSPTRPVSSPERRSPNCYGSGTSNHASEPWGRAGPSL